MTDNEILCAEMAALYELRLKISACGKKEYTAEEITELIDKAVLSEDRELKKFLKTS